VFGSHENKSPLAQGYEDTSRPISVHPTAKENAGYCADDRDHIIYCYISLTLVPHTFFESNFGSLYRSCRPTWSASHLTHQSQQLLLLQDAEY